MTGKYNEPPANWRRLRSSDFYQTIKRRAHIIRHIRRFFDSRGFLEVETPQLVKLPGQEPYLYPFKTSIQHKDGGRRPAFLITSPEYHMRKLICGGLEKIYQLTSSFRDHEERSPFHNPEFRILEWYRVNANYMDIANDLQKLLYYLCLTLTGGSKIRYKNYSIDLAPPFDYLSVEESFKKYLDLDLSLLMADRDGFIKAASGKGYELDSGEDWETTFYKLFLSHVEPKLGIDKPTILYDYPASMASLSKLKEGDEKWAERFELYLGGVEIANAFSELTDWSVQLKRLEEEKNLRAAMGRDVYDIDSSFIEALKYGMPECGGIALGVDRLVMVMLNKNGLEDVMLFPGKDVF